MSLFLNVKEAAAELSVPPVNVLRLIALAILPATKLPDGWKLDPEKLREYVARGARKLAMPPLSRAGWFNGDNTESAQDFFMAAREAMRESIHSEAPESLFPKFTSIATVELKANDALRRLMRESEPRPPRVKGDGETFPRNWRDVYLMDRLRKAAHDEFNVTLTPPVQRLYSDGPQAFDKLTTTAAANVLQGAIKLRVPYQLDGRSVEIDYRLPHGELMGADDISRLIELAF